MFNKYRRRFICVTSNLVVFLSLSGLSSLVQATDAGCIWPNNVWESDANKHKEAASVVFRPAVWSS